MTEPTEPPTAQCDLLMKGGISSGVIYPKLIARLAQNYRFRSIGGTSAGAIAAAACAAAEFARCKGVPAEGTRAPFERLADLPSELGARPTPTAPSMLLRLFQPAPALAPHFAVLLSMIKGSSPVAGVFEALWKLLRRHWAITGAMLALAYVLLATATAITGISSYWYAAGAGIALWLAAALVARFAYRYWLRRGSRGPMWTTTIWWLLGVAGTLTLLLAYGSPWPASLQATFSWAVVVPIGFVLAAAAALARFLVTFLRGLKANFWGMCRGRTERDPSNPGLTDWLTRYLDDLAGLSPESAHPLTFGDLWRGRRDVEAAAPLTDADCPASDRVVDLQVVTSAVSQRMAYSIPFRENTGRLYYDPAEWERLFPESVMRWLAHASAQLANQDGVAHVPPRSASGASLSRLPRNQDLPVVVAVRMSLSFPILLSAVPLYAIDYSDQEPDPTQKAPRLAKKIWFSDGGLCSNMPLHFFDAPLPQRPTFAINLKKPHPRHPINTKVQASDPSSKRVYLTQKESAGQIRYWDEPSQSFAAFVWSLISTMKDWRDEIQFPYPGFRDRIVQISHLDNEGGLNLDMPAPVINALGDAGHQAAVALAEKFGGEGDNGWERHRRTRLRTFLGLTESMLQDRSLTDPAWDQVADATHLIGAHYTLEEAQQAKQVLAALRDIGATLGEDKPRLSDKAPKPRPGLRIMPRI